MLKTRVAMLGLAALTALTLAATASADRVPASPDRVPLAAGQDFGQPKMRRPRALVSDFGVSVRVTLAVPLDRTAAQAKVSGAGLVLAIEHENGSRAGMLLRDSRTFRKTQAKGLGGPVVAMTKGREAWLFVADPNIARVALGGFVQAKGGGARASIESAAGLIADTAGYFLPPLTTHLAPEQFGFGKVTHAQTEYCNEVKRQLELAEEVLREIPRNPFPAGSDDAGHWARSVAALKKWMAKARAYLAAHCVEGAGSGGGPAGGGQGQPILIDGGGLPANEPPAIAEVKVPDSGKAGKAVDVDGKASDADGQVTSWTWNWGDGTSTSGSGPTVKSGHAYSGPGRYNVTLTVTDDQGVSTTSAPAQIAVGAAGSKSSDEFSDFEIECPDAAHSPGDLVLDVFIPSYAEEPITINLTPAPKVCPDSAQTVTVERINGNVDGEKDEWGNFKDTYRVKVHMTHEVGKTGGQTVTTAVTVNWK